MATTTATSTRGDRDRNRDLNNMTKEEKKEFVRTNLHIFSVLGDLSSPRNELTDIKETFESDGGFLPMCYHHKDLLKFDFRDLADACQKDCKLFAETMNILDHYPFPLNSFKLKMFLPTLVYPEGAIIAVGKGIYANSCTILYESGCFETTLPFNESYNAPYTIPGILIWLVKLTDEAKLHEKFCKFAKHCTCELDGYIKRFLRLFPDHKFDEH